MDPTAQELAAANDVAGCAAWSGVRGDPADPNSILGSFVNALGADAATPLRTLAAIPAQDWTVYVGQWTIPQLFLDM